jgi:hypothetical protein
VNCGKVCVVFTPAPVPLSIFVSPSEIASASRVQGRYPAGGFTPATRLAFQISLTRVCFQECAAWLKKTLWEERRKVTVCEKIVIYLFYAWKMSNVNKKYFS